LLVGAAARADEKAGTDGEGFVQQWLVLAPIPLKDGEDGMAGHKELAWKAYAAKDHLLDFNGHLGAQTEDAIGYAVTYVTAPADMAVKMKTGSDDQCKVWLNGKDVFKFTDARPAEKDQDTTEVMLKKGVNVLVVKVVNEKVDWSFCVRFTDKDDKPVAGLTAKAGE
jgi:hypothetical protein